MNENRPNPRTVTPEIVAGDMMLFCGWNQKYSFLESVLEWLSVSQKWVTKITVYNNKS